MYLTQTRRFNSAIFLSSTVRARNGIFAKSLLVEVAARVLKYSPLSVCDDGIMNTNYPISQRTLLISMQVIQSNNLYLKSPSNEAKFSSNDNDNNNNNNNNK